MSVFKSKGFLLLGLFLFPILGLAQSLQEEPTNRAAQYYLGDRDQLLMAVNVWGFVSQPGQYMVPYDTDLIALLSYAGGPREEARIKSIKIIRNQTTAEDKTQGTVIEVDVKKFIKTGQLNLIPVLKPGDTVVVSGTTFHLAEKSFDILFRLATLVQLYYFIRWYSDRN